MGTHSDLADLTRPDKAGEARLGTHAAGALTVLDLGEVSYEEGLALQDDLLERRARGEISDHLLLLTHPHVFTFGRRGKVEHLVTPDDEEGRPIPVHHVGRGGDITYHGPGQLVGYPIVDLGPRGNDVIRYLRDLEGALIAACAALGVAADRNPPFTGIWSQGQKLASIGVAVRRNVTQHGFALNVSTDLGYFDRIIPCGLHWARMTSLERLVGHPVSFDHVKQEVTVALTAALGG